MSGGPVEGESNRLRSDFKILFVLQQLLLERSPIVTELTNSDLLNTINNYAIINRVGKTII